MEIEMTLIPVGKHLSCILILQTKQHKKQLRESE